MADSSVSAKGTPESQLLFLIEKFDAKNQQLIRSVRAALRKRFPTANELVYDYGFSLVIAYSPTEQGIEGILSISARADDGVSLYFTNGPKLPDPKKLLSYSDRLLVRFSERDCRLPRAAAVARHQQLCLHTALGLELSAMTNGTLCPATFARNKSGTINPQQLIRVLLILPAYTSIHLEIRD